MTYLESIFAMQTTKNNRTFQCSHGPVEIVDLFMNLVSNSREILCTAWTSYVLLVLEKIAFSEIISLKLDTLIFSMNSSISVL